MGERPAYPTQAEVTQAMIEQFFENRFVALPGTIQTYDPATQRADVVVGVKNVYPDPEGSGEQLREEFPVVPHVKVCWPRSGPWFLAMSMRPGDRVQLLFNTLDPSAWLNGNGNVADVPDTRRQHLSHAVALPCMNINSEALAHAPPGRPPDDAAACLTLGSDLDAGVRLSIFGDGRMVLTKGTDVRLQVDPDGTVHLAGAPEVTKLLALAELVDARLSTIKSAHNTHTHPATMGTTSATTDGLIGTLESVSATKTKGV